MTNFFVYMLGTIIVAGALAYGAHLLGVNARWIGVGVAVIIGLGVMTAIVKTRSNSRSANSRSLSSAGPTWTAMCAAISG